VSERVRSRRCILRALCGAVLAACAAGATCDPTRVVLMTFNVENLFDTEDDPRKLDDTFLPLERA
jgi:hypothetical protein